MCLVVGCSLATDVADGHFPEPEPEPVPDEEEEECHDNNSASIVATGYDCAAVVRRQECLLVYQFCRCSCGAAQSQAAAPPLQNDCAVVPGFLPPIIGALAGHDMQLSADDSVETADEAATSAEECGFICALMDGSPGSAVSRRWCFSFDWSEKEQRCLLGSGAVSRHEPGELGNAHIDATATNFCYYERLWDMEIPELHAHSAARNPLLGRLVRVSGIVTAVVPPPIAAGEAGDDEHVDGGLPEGFFLQQGRVGTAPPATCAARAQLPAVFVRSTRFTPLAGSFVEVTAIAFTFSEHVELTGAHHH